VLDVRTSAVSSGCNRRDVVLDERDEITYNNQSINPSLIQTHCPYSMLFTVISTVLSVSTGLTAGTVHLTTTDVALSVLFEPINDAE